MSDNVSSWLKQFKLIEKLSNKNLMSIILAILIILGTSFLWMPFTPMRIYFFSLYSVGVVALSILLMRLTIMLYFRIRVRKLMTKKSTGNVLKEIGEEAYKIEQGPMIFPVNINEIAQKLNLSPAYIRHLTQQLIKLNCLKYDYDGNIFGISDDGIEAMGRNKLI